MPGKGQPGVESGSQTQVTAQSFPSKCPSTVPPARLGGHPPPCRESDHLVRNGFLSPQLTPLPAFQPFSRCFSLLPPSPYLCLSVCLSLTPQPLLPRWNHPPAHPAAPSGLHPSWPRASPWSSLLLRARLLESCAPLLRALRGPPCLARPPQEPLCPDPLLQSPWEALSSTPRPPCPAGGGERVQVTGRRAARELETRERGSQSRPLADDTQHRIIFHPEVNLRPKKKNRKKRQHPQQTRLWENEDASPPMASQMGSALWKATEPHRYQKPSERSYSFDQLISLLGIFPNNYSSSQGKGGKK